MPVARYLSIHSPRLKRWLAAARGEPVYDSEKSMPNAAQTMRELRAKQMREHAKRVAENRREREAREALEQAETEPPKESA